MFKTQGLGKNSLELMLTAKVLLARFLLFTGYKYISSQSSTHYSLLPPKVRKFLRMLFVWHSCGFFTGLRTTESKNTLAANGIVT